MTRDHSGRFGENSRNPGSWLTRRRCGFVKRCQIETRRVSEEFCVTFRVTFREIVLADSFGLGLPAGRVLEHARQLQETRRVSEEFRGVWPSDPR